MVPVSERSSALLRPVADQFGLADIYVFGSRADEVAKDTPCSDSASMPDSDVDIAVRPLARRTLTPTDRVDLTRALRRESGGIFPA
jgi:predicted nucleotidyltransferase